MSLNGMHDSEVDISDKLRDEKLDDIINRMSKSKSSTSNKKKETEEINYDDVEFDQLDEKTKKAYSDLFQGMIDVYKIIGVKDTDTQETINKKCAEKLKKYRPDNHSELVKKYPEDEQPRELKRLGHQYTMIRDACSILRDPKKKKYYDLQKKTVHSKDFFSAKDSFDTFRKLQDSKVNDKTKKLAESNFKLQSLDLDKKHGFDRNLFNQDKLTTEETNRRYDDLDFARESERIEIELAQKDMFDGKPFDPESFHKAFAKQARREEKRNAKKGNGDRSLMKWEGISASNDVGLSGNSNYISIDNYEDLYAENNFGESSNWASKLNSSSESGSESSSESDFDDDKFQDERYDKYRFDGHSKGKEATMSRFEDMMNRRNQEDKDYDNRKYEDRNTWKSVFENPMNISSAMGDIVIGDNMEQLEGQSRTKMIAKDRADVYKQILFDESDDEKPKRSKTSSKNSKLKDKKQGESKESKSSMKKPKIIRKNKEDK